MRLLRDLGGIATGGGGMHVYRCQDSLESVFTAIFKVYEEHVPRDEVILALDEDPRLFAVDHRVEPDSMRSEKVARTLIRRFGMEDYERVCLVLSTPDTDKAQLVYRTVVQGLERDQMTGGQKNSGKSWMRGHLFDNLAVSEVCKAFQLARSAERENCHLQGFVRFEELKNGILYAKIRPKNHILPFLMAHFSDRFPEENFLLHDVGRDLIGMHSGKANSGKVDEAPVDRKAVLEKGDHGQPVPGEGNREKPLYAAVEEWILVSGAEISEEKLELSDAEEQYQELFRHFCSHIGIKERKNAELQRNLLPIHFRRYMPEFV